LLTTLTTILAFLFVLGVLVFVHEFGHFIVARLYGVRVITFSLGFGPKLLKYQGSATEYCVSAVPLGGYVKLAGETVEDGGRTGAPDEFLSKSKWIRFQVYLAGPVMNMLLAVVLLTVVLLRGADVPLYETSAPVVGSVAAGSSAEKAGVRVGDRIVRINGRDVPTWNSLWETVATLANREISVDILRRGDAQTLRVTPDAVTKFEVGSLGIGPVIRPQINTVSPGKPADLAGIKAGDVVLAVDGVRGLPRSEITSRIRASKGPLVFTIERKGEVHDISVTPDSSSVIGVTLFDLETRRIDPNFIQAVGMSAQQNWDSAVTIGRTLKGLLTRETPVKQLMGPVAIAQMSGEAVSLGWVALLNLMAMISLNLGLLNLMPIPVFDGGHIAILGVEGLYQRFSHRDLSVKVKERILLLGAGLVVLLMVTVIFNDVMRLMK
jgi:regulator of sigma E protease